MAGAISCLDPFTENNLRLASLLAEYGLLAPFISALTLRELDLRRDVFSRQLTLSG